MVFSPIHRALGVPAGEISLGIIEQAIENRVEESADLDWKQQVYNPQNPKWEEEAAKDIAAMANSGGGWIVFGVAEDKARNAASELTPVSWSATTQQQILRVAYAKIGPPVLGIEFHVVTTENGDVVAMRVPDSRDAPHFARKGDNAFSAPRRNGPHTVFMSDREIERGFRERFQYSDDRERNLQDKFGRVSQALKPSDGVFIAMAALPLEPRIHAKSPGQDVIRELVSRQPIPELILDQNSCCRWNLGQVRIGMRQWVVRSDPEERVKCQIFLYDDSTVLAAYQLGNLTDRDEAKPSYPVGLPNHCMSQHVESAVINFITVLRGHAEERHANGGFRIRTGLIGAADKPIYIRTTEERSHFLVSEKSAVPISVFEPVTIELDPLSPPLEMLPQVNDLARDLINQGGVKDLKIIADPKEYEQESAL